MSNVYLHLRKIFTIGTICSCVFFQDSIFCYFDVEEKNTEQDISQAKFPIQNDFDEEKQTYIINFKKVSIIEYIRFVSKITKLNFIFNEEELDFNITIVSEEKVTLKDVMSVLIQVLRIHGLVVLEEDNNFLITKIRSVTQMATIVATDDLVEPSHKSPLVTRIFKIKNANLQTVAGVIKPMLSESAILEISAETKQLIITDITTNVDKIAALLVAIDSPIDQRVYLYSLEEKKSMPVLNAIAALSKEIKSRNVCSKLIDCLDSVKWVQDSNAMLFIGDGETIAQVKEVLTTLETQSCSSLAQRSFFVYPIKQATFLQLKTSLQTLAQDLQKSLQPDSLLIEVLNGFSYNKEANSLIFTGEDQALGRLKQILPMFDVASAASKAFFIYHPIYLNGEDLQQSTLDLASNLQQSGLSDDLFIQALLSVNWVPAIKALVFIGSDAVLSRINVVLASIDTELKSRVEETEVSSTLAQKTEFFVYHPAHLTGLEIKNILADLGQNFQKAGLTDADVLATIDTVQYVEGLSALLFTGTEKSIEKIQGMLVTIDAPIFHVDGKTTDSANPSISYGDGPNPSMANVPAGNFSVYSPKHQTGEELINILKELKQGLLASGVSDKALFNTIDNIRYIARTNSLIVSGDVESIGKVEGFLARFDCISQDTTNTTPSSIESIQNASSYSGGPSPSEANVPAGNFSVYSPKHQTGEELINILKELKQGLLASGVSDKALFNTIDNIRYIARTNSLIVSGNVESVGKVEGFLARFDCISKDTTNTTPSSIESIENASFLIYKLQYHQGSDILSALKQIATDLAPGMQDQNQQLANIINSLQWVRVTNSLLASGDAALLAKVEELIQNLDIPLKQVFIEILVVETNVNNAQNFGLQWGGKIKYLDKFCAGTGNFPVPSSSIASSSNPAQSDNSFRSGIGSKTSGTTGPIMEAIPFFSGFDFGVIGDIIMHKGKSFLSLGSLVNALQSDTDSTVVLNPKIITQDNRTSTIFVGQNIPFVGSQVSTSAQIISTTSNIEYRDVGFNLTITPTIGSGDIITLDIDADISQVTGNPNIAISNDRNQSGRVTGIQTSHTSMKTRVNLQNEHFVVLSGMISDHKFHYKSGIPCLGGLPLIGSIFSETDRVAVKQNVIFFIRPHIISTYKEYKSVTDRQEDLHKNAGVLPMLKEEFDGAIDLVKQPNNE